MCNLKRSGAFTEKHFFVNLTVLFTHFLTKARNDAIIAWLTELPSHSMYIPCAEAELRNFRASSHTICCMLKRNCGFVRFCEVLRPRQQLWSWSKDLKFRFRTFSVWYPKMWSSASACHLCLDLQKCEVSLPYFCSALTAKDLKFGVSTNTLSSFPKMWSSASALPLGLDCQRSEFLLLPHFPSAFIRKVMLPHFSSLHGLPKMWSFASALPFCLDCQIYDVLLLLHFRSAFIRKAVNLRFRTTHFCLVFKICDVSLPHFHSALIAKDMKFHFLHTSALPSFAKL